MVTGGGDGSLLAIKAACAWGLARIAAIASLLSAIAFANNTTDSGSEAILAATSTVETSISCSKTSTIWPSSAVVVD